MAARERELSPSAAIEDALWAAARRELGEEALARRALAAAIADRSRRYTRERARLGEGVGGRRARADLAARAVFFSVCDSPKLAVPIFELAGRGALPGGGGEPLRVLDLGAGCGGAALGVLDAIARLGRGGARGPEAEFLAVDRDADALAIAAAAARESPWRALAELEVRRGDARAAARGEGAGGGAFDLIVAAGLLNEIGEDDARALAEAALSQLSPRGAFIAVEPALRDTARALHRVRDAALAEGAEVFAPCTRARAPCPALADPRDWCHEDRPVRLPPRARALADATGLRERGAKFSYLVLRRERLPLVSPRAAAGAEPARVVSSPRKHKGSAECFACADVGRVRLRRLSRHRSAENRAFDRARRGDVLLAPAPALAAGRLGADDAVARVEPASPSGGHDPDEA